VKDADLAAELKLVKDEEVYVQDIPNKPGFVVIFTSDGGVKFPVPNKDVALVKIDKEAEYEMFREARARAARAGTEDADGEEWEDFAEDGSELLEDEELLDYALESELLGDGDEDPDYEEEEESPEVTTTVGKVLEDLKGREEHFTKALEEGPGGEEDDDEGLLVDDDEDLYDELLAEDPEELDSLEDDEDFDEEGNLVSDEDKKLVRAAKRDAEMADKHSAITKKVLDRGDGPKGKPLFAKKREKGSAGAWARLEVLHGRTKPYDAKEDLKALKFRWDNTEKVWWKRVRDSQIDEVTLLVEEIGCKIRVVPV